jgi:hypothetical protein
LNHKVIQVVKAKKPRKAKKEKGSIFGLLGLILSFIAFFLWALYIPFTFSKILSLLCLAVLLPLSLILIVMGIIFSSLSLRLGAGKRKLSAIIGLVFSIMQVLLWIGWIVFTTFWNIGALEG